MEPTASDASFDPAASLHQARDAVDALLRHPGAVQTINSLISACAAALGAGHKLMICGNGGSACDAAHFAEELTGRFRFDRRPLAAIACTDVGHITCTANDYGFEHVFARWVEALARPGDVVILLSTSGASPNILKAAEAARAAGAVTIAMLGKGGGALRGVCALELIVPGHSSDRIQELHMLVLHIMVEGIEASLQLGRAKR
ncbi:MAG: SIS domain-containing protein [Planctomycetota bacterium]|nr:SIS domain-containing protein [Planctomycetota bacterium]